MLDIISALESYGIEVVVSDHWADKQEASKYYGLELVELELQQDLAGVLVAVSHDEYEALDPQTLRSVYREDVKPVICDVRSILDREAFEAAGYNYWRL